MRQRKIQAAPLAREARAMPAVNQGGDPPAVPAGKDLAPGASLFSILPAEISTALLARGRTMRLDAGQTLFVAGDPGDGCYSVAEGLLKVSIVSPNGGERILAILGPGAVVGELSILDDSPRSAAVIAVRETRLQFVSRAAFDFVARDHPEVFRHLAILLARRLRDIDDTLAATGFMSLKGRVARALIGLAEAFGKDVGAGRILIRQKLNQSDIAAMAGISRENVSRILQDWMRRALVSRLAGYYCLENKTALDLETKA
jgi:CRP/FNR family transcriptional regulator, cyclic AMP receptor protein